MLIVEPILMVGTETCIENPLTKAEIALGKVFGNRVSFRRAGVPRKVMGWPPELRQAVKTLLTVR